MSTFVPSAFGTEKRHLTPVMTAKGPTRKTLQIRRYSLNKSNNRKGVFLGSMNIIKAQQTIKEAWNWGMFVALPFQCSWREHRVWKDKRRKNGTESWMTLKEKVIIVINILKMLCIKMYEVVFSRFLVLSLENGRVEPSVLFCISMSKDFNFQQNIILVTRTLHQRLHIQMHVSDNADKWSRPGLWKGIIGS